MDITSTLSPLTASDLEIAQKALRDAYVILDAITAGAERDHLYYEIGRAQGTLYLGLNFSGAKDIPSLAKGAK